MVNITRRFLKSSERLFQRYRWIKCPRAHRSDAVRRKGMGTTANRQLQSLGGDELAQHRLLQRDVRARFLECSIDCEHSSWWCSRSAS